MNNGGLEFQNVVATSGISGYPGTPYQPILIPQYSICNHIDKGDFKELFELLRYMRSRISEALCIVV